MSRNPGPHKDSASGTWSFVFDSVHPTPSGGRRQIRRRGFLTKKAAQAAMDQERQNDAALAPGTGGVLTVAMVLEQFIRTKQLAGRAPNTIEFYRWAAGLASARWGGWRADRLTGDDLDAAYLDMLHAGRRQYRRGSGTSTTADPMSARSVQGMHKTLKAAYALAVNRGQLLRNPAVLSTPPALPEQLRRWWTPEQVGRFLDFAAGPGNSLPAGLIEVLVDSGGRRGEVLALRWQEVDLDAGTATVSRQLVADAGTKVVTARATKRPRSKSTIGLHPATVAALRHRRAEQGEQRLKMGAGWPGVGTLDDGLVFTWPDGTFIHPDVLTRTIHRLSMAAGLPALTPHGLRHAFASAALSARVPVEVVAARLGNTARVVQEVYAHVIPADDGAAAQLVGDLYRARPTGL
jgi:integrase